MGVIIKCVKRSKSNDRVHVSIKFSNFNEEELYLQGGCVIIINNQTFIFSIIIIYYRLDCIADQT